MSVTASSGAYVTLMPMPAAGGGVPGANGYRTSMRSGGVSVIPTSSPRFVPSRTFSFTDGARSKSSGSEEGRRGSRISPGRRVALLGKSLQGERAFDCFVRDVRVEERQHERAARRRWKRVRQAEISRQRRRRR